MFGEHKFENTVLEDTVSIVPLGFSCTPFENSLPNYNKFKGLIHETSKNTSKMPLWTEIFILIMRYSTAMFAVI